MQEIQEYRPEGVLRSFLHQKQQYFQNAVVFWWVIDKYVIQHISENDTDSEGTHRVRVIYLVPIRVS